MTTEAFVAIDPGVRERRILVPAEPEHGLIGIRAVEDIEGQHHGWKLSRWTDKKPQSDT